MRWIGIAAIIAISVAVSASEDDNLAAATNLARAIGVSGNPMMAAQLRANLVVTNPKEIPPSAEPVVEAWLLEMFDSPQWNLEAGKVLTTHLQPEDIAVLQAQFESAAWRRYQEALPRINKAMSDKVNQAIRDGAKDLQKRIREAERAR